MDAFTTALTLLSRRELSTKQLRDRLARRKFVASEIDDVVGRLTRDGTLDDRRVAVASARTDATVRRHGRRRALQRVQQLGIDPDLARLAVDEAFDGIDEQMLLDAAIERRLRGADARTLDTQGKARLVRHLVARGFDSSQVFARLRKKGADTDE
jgi:regulatory protein